MSVIVCVTDSDGATVRKGDRSTWTEDWDPKSNKKGTKPRGTKHCIVWSHHRYHQIDTKQWQQSHLNFCQDIFFFLCEKIYDFFQKIYSKEMCIYFIKLLSSGFKIYEFGNPGTCWIYVCILKLILILLWKLSSLELN